MNYTKRLYDLRTDNDLTQEDVARILNTTKQNYGRYENGKRKLSIDDLITLSKFYKVSTDYILCLKDEP
ncbi:MAG: helix-turn-helix transcriptional regulator [Ruminococcaceae bacterium]|nr:helix-turn-helix transcriptional regulator [Oscillospiraceae bacterium]